MTTKTARRPGTRIPFSKIVRLDALTAPPSLNQLIIHRKSEFSTSSSTDDGGVSQHGPGISQPVAKRSAKQILCVENEGDACSAIASALSSYELSWAGSIDDARTLYCLQRFSLIFISDDLPDGDGLKLCEEIRDSDYLTPIIIMTRNPDLSEIETRIAGAQRLLKKNGPDYLRELRVLADCLSV